MRAAPRVILSLAVALLVAGVVVHRGDPAAVALLVLYLGWLLVEAPVALRSTAAPQDAGTIVLYGAARLACIAGCLFTTSLDGSSRIGFVMYALKPASSAAAAANSS